MLISYAQKYLKFCVFAATIGWVGTANLLDAAKEIIKKGDFSDKKMIEMFKKYRDEKRIYVINKKQSSPPEEKKGVLQKIIRIFKGWIYK